MKQIRANEQIKQQLPHTQEKKREDETGKIAPLFKKKKTVVLSAEGDSSTVK